jgi:hypothetical protein
VDEDVCAGLLQDTAASANATTAIHISTTADFFNILYFLQIIPVNTATLQSYIKILNLHTNRNKKHNFPSKL